MKAQNFLQTPILYTLLLLSMHAYPIQRRNQALTAFYSTYGTPQTTPPRAGATGGNASEDQNPVPDGSPQSGSNGNYQPARSSGGASQPSASETSGKPDTEDSENCVSGSWKDVKQDGIEISIGKRACQNSVSNPENASGSGSPGGSQNANGTNSAAGGEAQADSGQSDSAGGVPDAKNPNGTTPVTAVSQLPELAMPDASGSSEYSLADLRKKAKESNLAVILPPIFGVLLIIFGWWAYKKYRRNHPKHAKNPTRSSKSTHGSNKSSKQELPANAHHTDAPYISNPHNIPFKNSSTASHNQSQKGGHSQRPNQSMPAQSQKQSLAPPKPAAQRRNSHPIRQKPVWQISSAAARKPAASHKQTWVKGPAKGAGKRAHRGSI